LSISLDFLHEKYLKNGILLIFLAKYLFVELSMSTFVVQLLNKKFNLKLNFKRSYL